MHWLTGLAGTILVGLAAGLCAGGCGGGAGIYRSPVGEFTYPVAHPHGTAVRKQEEKTVDSAAVIFSDDAGYWLRIATSRIDPAIPIGPEGQGREAALEKIFAGRVMPSEFLRMSGGSMILHEEYVETAAGKGVFAAVLVPPGAEERTGRGAGIRPSPVRGALLLARGNFLYVIIIREETAATTQPTLTMEDRFGKLAEELERIAGRMVFH